MDLEHLTTVIESGSIWECLVGTLDGPDLAETPSGAPESNHETREPTIGEVSDTLRVH